MFLLASDLPEGVNVRPLLNGLVPDQHSKLHRPADLRIDAGISADVKDIANAVDIDLRSELLHNGLVAALSEPGYEAAKALVDDLLGEPYPQTEAVDNILEKLNNLSSG